MKLLAATLNKDKFSEIKSILAEVPGLALDWLVSFPEIDNIEETGSSLEENSKIKAETASLKANMAAIADDTGLFVDYLDGAPGIHSARYAGEKASYEDNVTKLLSAMEGVPEEKRTAKFRTIACITIPGRESILVTGEIAGRITNTRRGTGGFGYDPVFEVEEYGKTFSELDTELKNTISHRYLAFKKVKDLISLIIQAQNSALPEVETF